jgi:hypothetical protein
MCLICIEYEKKKLNINEALRNLEEMKDSISAEHYDEALSFLTDEMLKKQYKEYYQNNIYDDEYWEKTGFGD